MLRNDAVGNGVLTSQVAGSDLVLGQDPRCSPRPKPWEMVPLLLIMMMAVLIAYKHCHHHYHHDHHIIIINVVIIIIIVASMGTSRILSYSGF